jgi:predicted permease
MQVPMLFGREFDERDGAGRVRAVIVNESFAKENFGDESPLGKQVVLMSAGEVEIVGVSKDTRYGSLKQDFSPIVYYPYNQGTGSVSFRIGSMTYAIRSSTDPIVDVKHIREIVRQADARVPVTNIRTQTAQIDRTMSDEILFARLCTAFALLALLIACVGLYGTVAYNVSRRTNEIGIRIALGARRRGVVWMAMREVVMLSLVGLALGLPLALGASRYVESYLFGMKSNDPKAIAGAVTVLLIAAAVAAFVPARRASRIDPMAALRHE